MKYFITTIPLCFLCLKIKWEPCWSPGGLCRVGSYHLWRRGRSPLSSPRSPAEPWPFGPRQASWCAAHTGSCRCTASAWPQRACSRTCHRRRRYRRWWRSSPREHWRWWTCDLKREGVIDQYCFNLKSHCNLSSHIIQSTTVQSSTGFSEWVRIQSDILLNSLRSDHRIQMGQLVPLAI